MGIMPTCRAPGTTGRSRRSSATASWAIESSTPRKRRRPSRDGPDGGWTTRPRRFTPGLNHAQWWTDPGRFISDGYRTSLIVDPPDGRIPALTAEGRARQGRGGNRNNAVNASWLDRGNQERCITYGLPSASLPTLYNNNIQIVQSPDSAVIVHEMIHEARVVPLDGRSRLNENVRGWIGDSRGRWEGDTLVVETTNFNGKNSYRGSTTGLHLVERYTRVADEPARAPAHGQRSDDMGAAVDGAAADAADRGRADRVRVSRTQLEHGQHPRGCA